MQLRILLFGQSSHFVERINNVRRKQPLPNVDGYDDDAEGYEVKDSRQAQKDREH